MNKNLFKTFAIAAMAVLAGACAKEQVGQEEQTGMVTFEVENPVAVTKAIGDGMTAKHLYYQVFDANGNPIAGLPVQTKKLTSLKTTVSFQLIKDQKYNFVFWAQTPTSGYYTIDETEGLKKITADYEGKKSNDENFDAFFAVEKDLVISGHVSKTVTLTRPFAQVNIGTNDELKAGTTTGPAIDLSGATSKVVVKGVPTVFAPLATTPEAMLTGATDVTFISAEVPTEKLVVKGVEYNYLAMNYVFAPAEGTVCDLTAEFALVGRAPIPLSSPATPIKRNYRTNILGKLLTSSADFNIEVDPGFGGDEDIYPIVVNGVAYKTLDAAVAAAKTGEQTIISLNNDMAGNGVKTINGQDVVIDLGGHTFDIDGSLVGSTGTETNGFQLLHGSKVTFKNGTLKSKKALLLIQNYSDLTLENVTLDATGGAAHYVLSNNHGTVKILGSTSILAPEGKHAFDVYYWPPAYSDGVNVYVNTTGIIRGAIEYACDNDEDACNKKTSLVIDNAVLENSKFETKLLTPNMKIARRVFADEAAAVAWIPAGYKLITDGDYYSIVDGSVTMVASQDELETALGEASTGDYLKLPVGTYTLPALTKSVEGVTFEGKLGEDGNPLTVIDLASVAYTPSDNGRPYKDVTFKNISFITWTDNYKGFRHSENLLFEGCTFTGKHFAYGKETYKKCKFIQNVVDYNIWTYGSEEITFNECLFDCQGKAVLIYNEKNQNPTPEHPEITEPFKINFNKCTFTAHAKATSSEGKTYGAIEIDSSISSPFNITITDCTSTGFSYDSAIYHVKKHKYNVSIVIDSNSVYNE